MSRQSEGDGRISGSGPSPATGLLFVLGSFGFFYGLLAVVDPLL